MTSKEELIQQIIWKQPFGALVTLELLAEWIDVQPATLTKWVKKSHYISPHTKRSRYIFSPHNVIRAAFVAGLVKEGCSPDDIRQALLEDPNLTDPDNLAWVQELLGLE